MADAPLKMYGMSGLLKTMGATDQQPVTRKAKYEKFDKHVTPPMTNGRGRMGRFDKTILPPEAQKSVDIYHATRGRVK